MTDIRVGVIGVGYLGYFHAEKYARLPGVQLVGVVDRSDERAAQVAETFGTRAFRDYRDLLPLVDAVSVVVPTVAHYPVATACLSAGRHVLLEKPMTTTLAEADELIAMAQRQGLVLQIGHLERYNPALLAMEGHLTRPMFIESHRIGPFKPRGTDVDVVLDLMIHDIDIVLSLVPADLSFMHAVGVPVVTPSTDIANVRMVFANGCTANLTVSRVSRETMRRVRIFQPKTYISVDYATRKIFVVRLADTLGPDGLPDREVQELAFGDHDALAAEVADFVDAVRRGRPPKVDGAAGRRALAVALEIMAQIRGQIDRYRQELGLGAP
ncbi:MAG: Gfo/Idh/MocA family oxidoreductase [Thermodesulfobacteriota bacterium]